MNEKGKINSLNKKEYRSISFNLTWERHKKHKSNKYTHKIKIALKLKSFCSSIDDTKCVKRYATSLEKTFVT